MEKQNESKNYHCQFELTLDIIGGKWKPLVLFYIAMNKNIRYGELRRAIPNINERMLTRQLRELEKDHLVHREIYKEVPPRVEYSLTSDGESIMPIIKNLHLWGVDYNKKYKISTFSDNNKSR